jgi:hypothetical protein
MNRDVLKLLGAHVDTLSTGRRRPRSVVPVDDVVAELATASPERLEQIYRSDRRAKVRAAVAAHPATPPSVTVRHIVATMNAVRGDQYLTSALQRLDVPATHDLLAKMPDRVPGHAAAQIVQRVAALDTPMLWRAALQSPLRPRAFGDPALSASPYGRQCRIEVLEQLRTTQLLSMLSSLRRTHIDTELAEVLVAHTDLSASPHGMCLTMADVDRCALDVFLGAADRAWRAVGLRRCTPEHAAEWVSQFDVTGVIDVVDRFDLSDHRRLAEAVLDRAEELHEPETFRRYGRLFDGAFEHPLTLRRSATAIDIADPYAVTRYATRRSSRRAAPSLATLSVLAGRVTPARATVLAAAVLTRRDLNDHGQSGCLAGEDPDADGAVQLLADWPGGPRAALSTSMLRRSRHTTPLLGATLHWFDIQVAGRRDRWELAANAAARFDGSFRDLASTVTACLP